MICSNGVCQSQTVGPDGKVKSTSIDSRINDDDLSSNFNRPTIGMPTFPNIFQPFPLTPVVYQPLPFPGTSTNTGGGISTRIFVDENGETITETKTYGPDGKVKTHKTS